MSESVIFELSPEAQQLLVEMKEWPTALGRAVCRAMDEANEIALANIIQEHMTGQGPFPPEEHKLGVRSGRLRGSMRASKAVVGEDFKVESAIGSNVKYGWMHEFGFVYRRKAGSVRLRTDYHGNLLGGGSGGAVFAKRSHKRFKEVAYEAHKVTVPERAYVRTGIREKGGEYTRLMSEAIVTTLGGRKQ